MARVDEAAIIRQANRASAVGQLLLGEFGDWSEFFKADTEDLEALPRKILKAGKTDVRIRLSKEIKRFCSENFIGMSILRLDRLYEAIKAHRGLEVPLPEFETKFAKVKDSVLRGQPRHCTVVISLWGLQFKYPEHMLASDIAEALSLLGEAESILEEYKDRSHRSVLAKRNDVSSAISLSLFASRACVLSCSNLVEAFSNGLAWDFSRASENVTNLSQKRKNLIRDGTVRDKLIKYPEIIAGRPLWTESDEPVKSYLEQVKPFRDSLVHPSPFSAPERYGGLDKLEHLYRIDPEKARHTAHVSVDVIEKMFRHIRGHDSRLPDWLQDLKSALSASKEARDSPTALIGPR